MSTRRQSIENAKNALDKRINQLDALQESFLVGPLSGKSNTALEKVSLWFSFLLTAALFVFSPVLVKYTLPDNAISSWEHRILLEAGLPGIYQMTYAAYFGVGFYLLLYAMLQRKRYKSIQRSRQCYSTIDGYKNKLTSMKNSIEATLSSIENNIARGNIKIEPQEKIDENIKVLCAETNRLLKIEKSAFAGLVRGFYWGTSVYFVIFMLYLRGEWFLQPINNTLGMDEMFAIMTCCVVIFYLVINVKLLKQGKGIGLGSYLLSLSSVPVGVLGTIAVIGIGYSVIALAQLTVVLFVVGLMLALLAGIMWAIFNG